MSKADKTYQEIADQILESLEAGTRPWEQCYEVSRGGFPKSVNNIEYTGTNRFLLTLQQMTKGYRSNVWLTFNEIRKIGGTVKGEKSTLAVFTKQYAYKDKKTGEDMTGRVLNRFRLFNTEQIKDLPDNYMDKFKEGELNEYNNSPIERAEQFISNIPATIETADTIPCYIPSKDIIRMPDIKHFKTTEQYYATLAHELIHHSGGKKRLNRKFKLDNHKEEYALEELVAEIGASFLLPSIGIDPIIDDEHAPYIAGYIKLLKNHPKAFVTACSKAEEATKFLKSFQ